MNKVHQVLNKVRANIGLGTPAWALAVAVFSALTAAQAAEMQLADRLDTNVPAGNHVQLAMLPL